MHLRAKHHHAALAVVLFTGVVPSFLACRSDSQTPRKIREAERIALIGLGKDHLTFAVLEAVAKQIGGHKGRLTIEVLAPEHATPADQQALLKNLPVNRYDAICIHPVDPEAVAEEMQRLSSTGVPIIAFGRDVPAAARSGYCGPLESDLGKATASACEQLVNGQSILVRSNSIILLHGGADNPCYSIRYQSFKTALAAMTGVNLLKELDCHANRLDAQALVKTESRKYPRVACWVLLGDWPLRGLAERDRLVPIESGIVLCDGDPVYFDRLRDGRIDALIGFDFREAASQAVYTALRLYESSSRGINASEISVAPEIIRRKDLDWWEARWKAWCTGAVPPTATTRGS